MPNLTILARNAERYRQHLQAKNLPQLKIIASTGDALTPETAAQTEIILGEPRLIREHLDTLTKLRWAQSIWAGVEPLVVPSLRQDYLLTNVKEVFGELMSEYIFGHLLAHLRHIFIHRDAQKEKNWVGKNTGSLRGKTLGIVGIGSIGAQVAKTAKFFGMTVHGYTFSSENSPDVDRYFHQNLPEFASSVDYLVNILPNTPATQKIFNTTVFEALPPHAIFINVGRGAAVDDDALLNALQRESIAAAVLDVFAEEPLPKEHPFWETPKLQMTFHTSAPSLPEDIVQLFAKNYYRYLNGEELQHQIDFARGY